MTSPALALSVAHLLAAAGPNFGATAVTAVADPPGPSASLVDLAGQVREALGARGVAVLSPKEIRTRISGTSDAPLEDLDRRYVAAIAAFQSGEYDSATRQFRALVAELETLAGMEGAFQRWSRSMLRLARAERVSGHAAEANRVLDRLLRNDPTAFADPDIYPPSFIAEIDAVRAKVRALPRWTLSVKTDAAMNLRVLVEGRDVGQAPATVSLPAGTYRVGGVYPGGRVRPVDVEIAGKDRDLVLSVSLEAMLARDGLVAAGPERAAAARAFGQRVAADTVAAASFQATGAERFLVVDFHDVHGGTVGGTGRLRLAGQAPPPGGVAALAALVVDGETSPLVELGLVSQTIAARVLPPAQRTAGGALVIVRLKHGAELRGSVVRKDERRLVIETEKGSLREIPMVEVREIVTP